MKPTSIKIIEKLRAHGHQAYWAGGCVRDILLGYEPNDYDIATSAKPNEIEKILENTKSVGKEFGVILVIEGKHSFEVATFRSDSGYSDGRRPDAILFTDAKEDALRRDFTINGMFYDPLTDEILDYVGGQKDLDAGLIRFIGNPHKRILEDHLRILRAVRFKNQFDFQYHPNTYKALKNHAVLVENVVAERVQYELNRMIEGKNRTQAFEDLSEIGILGHVIPELEDLHGVPQPKQYHQEGDVWDHSLRALKECDDNASRDVKWASLLHDIGKPDTFKLKKRIRYDHHVERSKEIVHDIFTRLKFPKKDRKEVEWLVLHHMIMVPLVEMPDGKARKWFLKENFLNLMQVFEADAKGIIPTDMSLYDKILARYRAVVKDMPVKPKPLITGRDVMKILQIPPSEKVGKILDEIYEKQLAKEIKTRAQALSFLKTKSFAD
ncbi:CCA tRNA nucleotidyltransferase [bacterium]|nr:CCA tRNA nucleotidyltransferase [bacterium]